MEQSVQGGSDLSQLGAMCILLVEDDANDVELTRACLGQAVGAGARVLHARTLAEAVDILHSSEVRLTLLDLDLPDSAGLNTIGRLCAATNGPVVVVTGNDHPALIQEALKRGAFELVRKQELEPERLMRIVRLAAMQERTESSLWQAAQRFRATFDHAAIGIAHVAPADGRFQLVNRKLCQMLGYSAEELAGRTVFGISHLEDHEVTREARGQMLAGGRDSFALSKRYLRKDGTTLWVDLTVSLVRDADGAPRFEIAMFEDITARKEAELRMARLKAMYAALSAANEAILRARSPQELFQRACEVAVESGGFTLSAVVLIDPASGRPERVAVAGAAAADITGLEIPPDRSQGEGRSLLGEVLDTGEPAISTDFETDGRSRLLQALADKHAIGSAAMFPLRRGGEIAGALGLMHADHGAFDDELVALLRRLADNVSFALENFAGDERRRQSDAALRESEARFRGLTELSSDWYWEQDEELRMSFHSSGFAQRSGTTSPKLLGKRRWEEPNRFPLGGTWDEHRATLEARKPFQDFEYVRIGDDGERHYVSLSGVPIFDATGSFKGYRGVGRNITERKRAEEQLRRFRLAMDNSADMIVLIDRATMRYVDVNGTVCAQLGYSREELLSMGPQDLLAVSREELERSYDDLIANPSSVNELKSCFRCKDGSLLPFESTRHVLRSGDTWVIAAIARDVRERLRSEERLRQSIERFEMVARATNDVVWDWNLLTDQMWWNDSLQSAFGWAPRDIGAYSDSWTSRIHPEDLEAVNSSVQEAIESDESSWAMEYRFQRRNGSYAAVHDRGLILRDAEGKPVRMIGAMVDITKRNRSERRLARHARRQEGVARLGEFALGKADLDDVFAEAVQVLRAGGCDVAVLLEQVSAAGEFVVRAASGEGTAGCVGRPGVAAPDAAWRRAIAGQCTLVADRAFFASRPADTPWPWLRGMASGAYAVVQSEPGPFGALCMNSLRENAFGEEDLRFAEAVANVLSATLRRHQAEARLAHFGQFDALTELPNRSLLHDRLEQSIARARRQNWKGAVLFIDLDRFKLVNDTLGHPAGDALIAEVGRRLQGCVRAGDTVGRVSGDEFAMVLTDLARADDAATVAQKILDALARRFAIAGSEAYVTASIGISIFLDDGGDAETLLTNADIAMYRAKESGRNAYCYFTAEMNERTTAKLQLNTDLRRAIERREFVLHYQPKLDLRDGSLVGAEALLRWNHPSRGLVPPAEFIPALEDSGLINAVGEWVIEEACAQLRRWQGEGLELVPVAVNLSAKQFLRRDLDAVVGRVLAAAGVPSGLIELEITESCLMEDPEEAVRVLRNLRAAGLKISVDDFGTGYSSLSYLTRLPLTALKIDRSFVRDAESSAEAASIVRTIIDMAHNLNFTVVAEGVETDAQAAFLRRHGCDLGQGYLFGRPVGAEEIAVRLREDRTPPPAREAQLSLIQA